ncbi:hypothetical protein [Actinomadura coerulea]|uniref:hypothetical protein n=1 Tax=Actinomadura coerulea TaxID=46159 RepID=UPI0034428023
MQAINERIPVVAEVVEEAQFLGEGPEQRSRVEQFSTVQSEDEPALFLERRRLGGHPWVVTRGEDDPGRPALGQGGGAHAEGF